MKDKRMRLLEAYMRAELKGIMSPDVPDLEKWRPESDAFSVMLELEIGPKNRHDSEMFYLEVISPKALAVQAADEGLLFGRGLLVMDTFSYSKLVDFIERWCAGTHGKTWEEMVEKLSRYAAYEFLDYVK
jgi:hypothetical protein